MDTMQPAPRHRSAYSARAKLGLIVPPTNTVNEAEWSLMLPAGVTSHTMRMALHADTGSDSGKAVLHRDLDAAMAMLVQARVDVVAYACTAGSMVNPPESLPARMAAQSGVPAVTTAAAIVAALHSMGLRRLAVATPYHDALNEHEQHFLTACGFEVLSLRGLGIGAAGPADYPRIAETPLADVAAHARAAMVPGADALLICCTDFPTLPLIAGLEAECGVPVITSNTATLWATLKAARIPDAITDAGKLLAQAR